MKKALCLLLVSVLLFSSLIPSQSFAATSDKSYYDGTWQDPVNSIANSMRIENGTVKAIAYQYSTKCYAFPDINCPINDRTFKFTITLNLPNEYVCYLYLYGLFTTKDTVSVTVVRNYEGDYHDRITDVFEHYDMVKDGSGAQPTVPAAPAANLTPGDISTYAGCGIPDYYGDNRSAFWASLDNPTSIALDSKGNLFIAGGYRIRKVDKSGIITTIAGNGEAGNTGDGASALSASITPDSIAVDINDNIFLCDTYDSVIRKIDSKGIITTIAGDGNMMSSGDGGPAVSASLCNPRDLAFDKSGNLYIADCSSIRKVDTDGIITTISEGGTDQTALICPEGLAVDSNGNVYVTDMGRLLKISQKGVITLVAGDIKDGYNGDGGPAASALFSYPNGLAVDDNGNVYIADTWNERIRKIDKNGIITTIAGNGTAGCGGDDGAATSAELNAPSSLALDKKNNILYITDSGNYIIRKVNLPPVTPIVVKPAAPSDFKVSIKGTTAALSWSAVTGAVSYKVYYKKKDGSYKTLTIKKRSSKFRI